MVQLHQRPRQRCQRFFKQRLLVVAVASDLARRLHRPTDSDRRVPQTVLGSSSGAAAYALVLSSATDAQCTVPCALLLAAHPGYPRSARLVVVCEPWTKGKGCCSVGIEYLVVPAPFCHSCSSRPAVPGLLLQVLPAGRT